MEFGAGDGVYHHFQVMSNELNTPVILVCPSDVRGFARDFSSLRNANISYFVNLDAGEATPAMPLCGDRNLLTKVGEPTPNPLARG